MQDSTTGRVDSFYVIAFTRHESTTEDKVIENLDVSLTEVATANPADTVNWNISLNGTHLGSLRFAIGAAPDSIRNYPGFFQWPEAGPELTFTSNGHQYEQVYLSSAYHDSISTERLSLAVNEAYGLIWLYAHSKVYDHTWVLLRQHIVR